ncbi:FecR family protein [Chitinophaga vietnamensis]|uniref:FecR family protein n=1 Tax=Chitinophaga vietnamensis TaxID=2593957 RepID=UPI0011775035|nr:FecR domain-containing protein [Chitinophaga vietnamensis]
MEQETNYWQQLVQHLNDPGNTALQEQVQQWLAQSPGHEALYRQVQQLWELAAETKALDELSLPAAIARLHAALPPDDTPGLQPVRRYKWFRVAAAVTIPLLALAWFLFRPHAAYLEKNTLAGNIDSIRLPDGSKVYLDKYSKIKFPEKMKASRTVILEQGNVFFEVNTNAIQPFIVKAGSASVTVLGTSFNMQLSNNRVDVGVKTGKVQFDGGQRHPQASVLSAGDGLAFDLSTGEATPFNAATSNNDAWLTHELVFIDAPLMEVCSAMESLYQVKISLQGKIPLKKLNATFKRNKLEEVLAVLQAAYPITVVQHRDTIIITGR